MLRVCNMVSRRSVGANVCVRSWRALATAARGKSFADLGVPSYLLPGLEKLNWTKPTEIQEKVLPRALRSPENVRLPASPILLVADLCRLWHQQRLGVERRQRLGCHS